MIDLIQELKAKNTREWLSLPTWARADLISYVGSGYVEEGTTLYFALCNDFVSTLTYAGDDIYPVLRELAVCIHNYIPGECHGSKDIVDNWEGLLSPKYMKESSA